MMPSTWATGTEARGREVVDEEEEAVEVGEKW
jgi:hypothetical protein